MNNLTIVKQGFEITENVFTHSEVEGLIAALDSDPLPRGRAGARHALRHSEVAKRARDERLLAIARQTLGGNAFPYRATLFDKSSMSNWLVVWHQDTALPIRTRQDRPGWGPWSIKEGVTYAHAPAEALEQVLAIRLHLDDSQQDNGPLRVLPNTHTLGVLNDDEIESLSRQIAPINCTVGRGGIIAMRPLLVHGSSKSVINMPRRVLHIEYAASVTIAEGLELAIADPSVIHSALSAVKVSPT